MQIEESIENQGNYEVPAGKTQDNNTSRSQRAAIYVRVSILDQVKERISLNAQLQPLRSYCYAMGWEIAEEYIDDGYSGHHNNRPGYQKMLKEWFKWDILLVFRLGRVHQNINNFYEMMENLNNLGKVFASLQDSIDTSTVFGKPAMDLIQMIGQLENEYKSERIRTRLRKNARQELKNMLRFHPNNKTPYGYFRNNGKVILDLSEAKTVREIFLLYSKGISIDKIKKWLNENNIKPQHNHKWGKGSVLSILGDPFYCGYHHFRNYLFKADHDPIVGIKLYNRVQKTQMKSIKSIKLCKSLPKLIDANQGELIPCS